MKIGKVNIEHTENGTIITPVETIKIIDLLNKIANGEEVPKNIRYEGEKYYYNNEAYFNEKTGYNLCNDIFLTYHLKDEVEIIEEDPEDEEIVQWSNIAIKEMKKAKNLSEIKAYIEAIMRTQNEIIEKIETLD